MRSSEQSNSHYAEKRALFAEGITVATGWSGQDGCEFDRTPS